MREKLTELLNNSYSPYSKFRVSAIVELNDGKLFSGVNVENASYGACICAERSALVSVFSNGYKKEDIKALHVMCGDSKKISMPCFICRQVMSEVMNKDSYVYAYNIDGDVIKYKVSELCPYPFDKEDLN